MMRNEDSILLDRVDFNVLHTLTQGTAVQQLCRYLLPVFRRDTPAITFGAALKRTQRRVYRLFDADLIEPMASDANPKLWRSTARALDLFSSARNSNSVQRDIFEIPKRCSEERKAAIKEVQTFFMLDQKKANSLLAKFWMYLNDLGDKVIILKRIIPAWDMSPFLIQFYQTRFNDPKFYKKNLFIYNSVWDAATLRYKRAVHLVLTTDPKRFKNLWEANRHFSIAFNRFMSYLTKHFGGKRPRYIASFEFTGSGLLHAHVIIFGVPYLLPHKVITQEWERCGQGSYNYIYSLINNNGDWIYAKGKPKKVKKGETAREYLKKYLKKGISRLELTVLYWLFNKRFFTYSRALYSNPGSLSLGMYTFLMVCYAWNIPDVILEGRTFFKQKPPPWDLGF